MTQDELDRIRDVTELNCAIFQREEDVAVTDAEGNWWLLGVLNGERVKRRMGFFGGYKSMQGPSDNE